MVTHPADRWRDSEWSLVTADLVLKLMASYRIAIVSVQHFRGFRFVAIGRRAGRNWIDINAAVAMDLLAVVALWPIMLVNAPWWMKAGVVLIVISIFDYASKRQWLVKYGIDPLIKRTKIKLHEKWHNSIVVLRNLVREQLLTRVRRNLNTIGGYLEPGVGIAKDAKSDSDRPRLESAKALEKALLSTKEARKYTYDFLPERAPLWQKLLEKVPLEKILVPLTPAALLPALGLWNGIGLCFAWVAAYHLLAWIGVAFYDSSVRAELLLSGSDIAVSDEIRQSAGNIDLQEKVLYRHLDIERPIGDPWILSKWPVIHPSLIIVMILLGAVLWWYHLKPSLGQEAVVFTFGATLLFNVSRPLVQKLRR